MGWDAQSLLSVSTPGVDDQKGKDDMSNGEKFDAPRDDTRVMIELRDNDKVFVNDQIVAQYTFRGEWRCCTSRQKGMEACGCVHCLV